jgi:hypothetical protein
MQFIITRCKKNIMLDRKPLFARIYPNFLLQLCTIFLARFHRSIKNRSANFKPDTERNFFASSSNAKPSNVRQVYCGACASVYLLSSAATAATPSKTGKGASRYPVFCAVLPLVRSSSNDGFSDWVSGSRFTCSLVWPSKWRRCMHVSDRKWRAPLSDALQGAQQTFRLHPRTSSELDD